jgi:hypothetical protein
MINREKIIGNIIIFVSLILFCVSVYTINVKGVNFRNRVYSETQFIKITNKDYVSVGGNAFKNNYRYVIYFIRYDKDSVVVKSSFSHDQLKVTEYDYNNLEVGEYYSVNEVNVNRRK